MEKPALGSSKTAAQLLDMYFLDMRCALLETAAALDRITRAEGGTEVLHDPRMVQLKKGMDLLQTIEPDRAERFLLLLSE
jgi:hypothetical protein